MSVIVKKKREKKQTRFAYVEVKKNGDEDYDVDESFDRVRPVDGRRRRRPMADGRRRRAAVGASTADAVGVGAADGRRRSAAMERRRMATGGAGRVRP